MERGHYCFITLIGIHQPSKGIVIIIMSAIVHGKIKRRAVGIPCIVPLDYFIELLPAFFMFVLSFQKHGIKPWNTKWPILK